MQFNSVINFFILIVLKCCESYRRLNVWIPSHTKPQSYPFISCRIYSTDQNSMNISNRANKYDYSYIKDLSEPLLDMALINKTIIQWTTPLPSSYITRPVVIVGPSAVGKGRLIKSLLKDYSRFFQKVVTHTTRNPRKDEINGTSYHYISNGTFQSILNNTPEYFIEYAQVHTNYYGISSRSLQYVIQNYKIPILEIDIQGAKTISKVAYKYGIKPWFIFIAPSDMNMLVDRLQIRGSENEDEMKIRLNNAKLELEEAYLLKNKLFKYIIINDNIHETTNLLFRIIRDEYPAIPSAARMRMLQRRLKKIKEIALSGMNPTLITTTTNNTTTTTTTNNVGNIVDNPTTTTINDLSVLEENDDNTNNSCVDTELIRNESK